MKNTLLSLHFFIFAVRGKEIGVKERQFLSEK
jgi:hypothetical protein